ncbi:MAG: aminopeptidase N, partial [Rhodanobacteraceae bacterium]
FRARFDGKPLVLDKWFALQALAPTHAALDRVCALANDPAFELRNPNRVQSLLGAFARNAVGFHRPDGGGYRFIAEKLIEIDALNPQNAARLAKAFESWRKLEPHRRDAARTTLTELNDRGGLSRDLRDILTRMLDG